MTARPVFASFLVAAALLGLGCGSRSEAWDRAPQVRHVLGLSRSFALIDESIDSVKLFAVAPGLSLHPSVQQVGTGVLNAQVSAAGDKLFVLSQGVQPRRHPDDERPALWVYDGTGSNRLLATYPLSDPLGGLALDPQGRYAVAYASAASDAFVQNPNELVVFDLSQPPSATNPLPRTIRSFGGRPQRLTFTPALTLPSGQRRLLLIETDQDLSILDLDHLDRKELTIKLSEQYKVIPAGLTFTEGSAEANDDTRIAVRTTAESSVYLLTLAAQQSATADNDFDVLINIVGLDAVPSDMAFVNTDAGQRLAVLEPTLKKAVLADPSTSVTSEVQMPEAYGQMDVVTQQASGAGSSSDVALLWGGASSWASGVAFWSLGKSVGQPYRSIETLPAVAGSVSQVLSVPAPNDVLRILVPGQNGYQRTFQVLNLSARTASPLQTSASNLSVTVAADGKRAWLFEQGLPNVAVIDLATLHPQNMVLDQPVWNLFDIADGSGGRAMVAMHQGGTFGATLLDASSPDEASATSYVGLLQGGY